MELPCLISNPAEGTTWEQEKTSLPLTLGDFFSYDLYPVFKSLISFHLIFYSFGNTAEGAIFVDAKLFPYMFQSVIPQMSYQVNSNISWFIKPKLAASKYWPDE